MSTPLFWIWLSTLTRLVVSGEDYYALPRWQWRESAAIASIIASACRPQGVRAQRHHTEGLRR